MITPSYSLTATERVLPRLALDFTTATLDPRVTFTRSGNTATVINLSGVIVGVNADIPRFDFDPVTLVCRGLLIEESRTNVLLNSLIDGTILGTQAVVVTAAVRTLSFYGTGQVVLSGAASATVTGTGAYPTRTTFTFTPSAGALTLTVTGTVQFAQLEVGAFATSYIPTEATALTRNADVATMTGTNFSDWFNASEGAFQVQAFAAIPASGSSVPLSVNDNIISNYYQVYILNSANRLYYKTVNATATQCEFTASSAVTNNNNFNSCFGYKTNNFQLAVNATLGAGDTLGTLPTVTQLQIGRHVTSSYINGCVAKINYWPQLLTNSEIRAFSK